jgi:hypothetical protein
MRRPGRPQVALILYGNRRCGRLPQRLAPVDLQGGCLGWGLVGGEVCLEGQTGRGGANVVVEVGVTAIERGQQCIRCRCGGIRVRRGLVCGRGGRRGRSRVRGVGRLGVGRRVVVGGGQPVA